jgi:hypothetical protein
MHCRRGARLDIDGMFIMKDDRKTDRNSKETHSRKRKLLFTHFSLSLENYIDMKRYYRDVVVRIFFTIQ